MVWNITVDGRKKSQYELWRTPSHNYWWHLRLHLIVSCDPMYSHVHSFQCVLLCTSNSSLLSNDFLQNTQEGWWMVTWLLEWFLVAISLLNSQISQLSLWSQVKCFNFFLSSRFSKIIAFLLWFWEPHCCWFNHDKDKSIRSKSKSDPRFGNVIYYLKLKEKYFVWLPTGSDLTARTHML